MPIFAGNGVVVLTRAATFFPVWRSLAELEPPAPGERVEVPLVVLDQTTGRELYRTSFTLENERIVAACADRTRLIVGIAGRDFTPSALEGRTIWYRIHATPLAEGGKTWRAEGEGFLGGAMLLEERGVTFPLYEGPLPQPFTWETGGKVFYRFGAHLLPLRAITLDPGSGERLGSTELKVLPGEGDFSGAPARVLPEQEAAASGRMPPRGDSEKHAVGSVQSTVYGLMSRPATLDPLFVPEALRRILPGTSQSVHAQFPWAHRNLFLYHPDRQPLPVLSEDPVLRTKILFQPCEDCTAVSPEDIDATILLWEDRLYFSIGGGVVLVKDFDGGRGVSPVLFTPHELSRVLR